MQAISPEALPLPATLKGVTTYGQRNGLLFRLKGPRLKTVSYRTFGFPEYGMANVSNFTRGFTPASNPERGNNMWATKLAFIYVKRPRLKNTNDQPIHSDTRSFICADDLCIASQGNDFNTIEASLTSALSTMTTYYDKNKLRANPSKTQVCAFHLMNREAKRELIVVWNGTRLSNTTTPEYLGIHLDRTLAIKRTSRRQR